MTLTEALVWLLQSDATVARMAGTRVYPLVAPQTSAVPWIAYQRISDVPHYSMTGYSRLTRTRVQISVEAATYNDLRALERAIKKRLGGYRGNVNGLNVMSAFVENVIDDYNPTTLHPMCHIDVMVMHDEE